MSFGIVSKIPCQGISVLSDPSVPRTFVVDCSHQLFYYSLFEQYKKTPWTVHKWRKISAFMADISDKTVTKAPKKPWELSGIRIYTVHRYLNSLQCDCYADCGLYQLYLSLMLHNIVSKSLTGCFVWLFSFLILWRIIRYSLLKSCWS